MIMTPTPEANSFLQFWIIVLFVAQLISLLVGIGVAASNRKQRREVSFAEAPASKRDFEAHQAECKCKHDSLWAKLNEDRHEQQIHISERNKTLYNKIETVRLELDTKMEDTRRELSDKIDAMSDRVIATLKNTGAI